MPEDGRSDDELMAAFQAGNSAALDLLFERYKTFVVNLAHNMGRDRAFAEDVLQKSFVWIMSHPGSYQGVGLFRAWLARIALNYTISEARRKKSSREIHVDTRVLLERSDSRLKTPPDMAAVREDEVQLSKAVRALPEHQRAVVVLSYFGGLTHPEIAQVLDCPEGTVKSRLNAALRNLAGRLGGSVDLLGGRRQPPGGAE